MKSMVKMCAQTLVAALVITAGAVDAKAQGSIGSEPMEVLAKVRSQLAKVAEQADGFDGQVAFERDYAAELDVRLTNGDTAIEHELRVAIFRTRGLSDEVGKAMESVAAAHGTLISLRNTTKGMNSAAFDAQLRVLTTYAGQLRIRLNGIQAEVNEVRAMLSDLAERVS